MICTKHNVVLYKNSIRLTRVPSVIGVIFMGYTTLFIAMLSFDIQFMMM